MAARWGIALVVVCALASCGGQQAFTPPSQSDIQKDLVRARTAQVALFTQSHMSIGAVQDSTATGTGAVDLVAGSGDVRQTVQSSTANETWTELLYVDGKGYRRSSASDWQKVNSGDPPLGQISPFSAKSLADQAGVVAERGHSVGTAVVAGVKTHEFRVTKTVNGQSLTLEAWFDSNGRLLQLSTSISGPALTSVFRETFLQFGVPVSVPAAPPVQQNTALPGL